jgi:hypothetical protein
MRYLLLLHGDEAAELAMTDAERGAVLAAHGAYAGRLREAGALVAGEALAPSSTSATVRIAPDRPPLVVDGPFAETKEQLGGFYIIECADREEALRHARDVPASPGLVVELRPIIAM